MPLGFLRLTPRPGAAVVLEVNTSPSGCLMHREILMNTALRHAINIIWDKNPSGDFVDGRNNCLRFANPAEAQGGFDDLKNASNDLKD